MILNLLKDRFALFKDKRFLLLSLSGFFSTFSNGLVHVTCSWYAYKEFQSISGVAIMMLLLWTPSILLGPLFGSACDRYNRKKLIILSTGARGIAILAFILSILLGFNSNIFFLVGTLGIFVSFYMPAVIPLITSVIPKDNFVKANSTIDMIYEVGTVLGMGVSGLLIHYAGVNMTLFFGGLFFLISATAMKFMEYKEEDNKEKRINTTNDSLWKEYFESLSYLVKNKYLLFVYLVQSFLNILLMTIPILLVPYTKEVLHASTGVFSIFESVYSLGILLGCLFVSELNDKLGFKKLMIILLLGMASSLFTMSISTNIVLSIIAYFVSGLCLSSWALVISQSQMLTKIKYQGRLQSFANSFSGIFILLIYLLITLKSEWISITGIYLLQALLTFFVSLILYKFIPKSLIVAHT